MGRPPASVPLRVLLGRGHFRRQREPLDEVQRGADDPEGGIRGGPLRPHAGMGGWPRHGHLHVQDAAACRGTLVMKFFTKKSELPTEIAARVPPGQYLTEKWPVLHYGSVPRFDPRRWDFRVFGKIANEIKLDWKQFQELDKTAVTADIPCVLT